MSQFYKCRIIKQTDESYRLEWSVPDADGSLEFEEWIPGIGFGTRNGKTFLRLHFPYTEEPVVFYGFPTSKPQDTQTHRFDTGSSIRFPFQLYIDPRDLHAYDPLICALYKEAKKVHRLNPFPISRMKISTVHRKMSI